MTTVFLCDMRERKVSDFNEGGYDYPQRESFSSCIQMCIFYPTDALNKKYIFEFY